MPALTTILIWGVVAVVVVGVGYFIFVLVAASIGWKRHYDGYDPDVPDTDWTDDVVLNLEFRVSQLEDYAAHDHGYYTGQVADEQPHGIGLWFQQGEIVPGHKSSIEKYAETWKEELLKGRIDVTLDGYQRGEFGDNIYVGGFKDGRFDGQGTLSAIETYYESGGVYVGGFKDDKRSGQGTWDYGDGWKYVGEFKNDLPHGHGSFTYKADGVHQQTDEWFDGNFEDGTQFVGEFMDEEPWTGVKTDYDKEGNVTKIIIYSKGQIDSTIDGDTDKVLRDLAESYIEPYYRMGYTRWSLFDMNMQGELPSSKPLSNDHMLRVIEHMAEITGDTKWRDNRDD